ncbi:hypothetical protein [Nitratidesulfovibrio liaohensis]|uniref:hypothetical protein n=1 Tax=Nitratidesulfovibrio liaohensis TaxID=2604158 RepID=UPI00142131D3|nr:hypothetical protein [Nitratidesulfovibrio liaohensis]NHZ48742.1 hypothetical protein [Nitratidesulfovibrio liaohensis]
MRLEDVAREVFGKIDAAQVYSKNEERLRYMIEYAVGRIDWYENQFQSITNFGIGLVTALSAIVPMVFQATEGMTIGKILLFRTFPSFAILLLVMTMAFFVMKKRWYAHRDVANIKSWYFVYNVHPDLGKFSDGISKESQVGLVVDGYRIYCERIMRVMNDELSRMVDDVEQIYVLFMIQKYSKKNYEDYRKCFALCMIVPLSLSVLASIIFWGE